MGKQLTLFIDIFLYDEDNTSWCVCRQDKKTLYIVPVPNR